LKFYVSNDIAFERAIWDTGVYKRKFGDAVDKYKENPDNQYVSEDENDDDEDCILEMSRFVQIIK
jgi:hypothetical protein